MNHHSVYESYFGDQFHSYIFQFEEEIDGIPYHAVYRFDYSDSLISAELTNGRDSTQQIHKHISITDRIFDRTALLYYLRFHAGKMKVDTLQYLSNGNIAKAVIRFSRRLYSVKIRSLNCKLSSYYLDGTNYEKTVAGLSGRFQAWIAADEQRFPLKAKLKVFIGHVTIELEKWNQ